MVAEEEKKNDSLEEAARDIDHEERARLSFTEYSDRKRRAKRVRVALASVLALLAVLFVGVLVAVVLLIGEFDQTAVKVAAQDDEAALVKKADETEITKATSEVTDLVRLLGMDQPSALAAIGHGAIVTSEVAIDSDGLKREVVVTLSEEKGDALSGTPTVVLRFREDGSVGSATYGAPTSALGYGSLSFSDAISKVGIVGNVVHAAGLSTADVSGVALPQDRASYSTYESDNKTLKTEQCTFSGSAGTDGGTYAWSVTLTYDYTHANQTGNLADTIRKVSVTVSAA